MDMVEFILFTNQFFNNAMKAFDVSVLLRGGW